MTYNCPYCGKTLSSSGDYVEVCQCPEAVQHETEYRERAKALANQHKQSVEEARKQNKRPIRSKGDDK